MYKPPLQRSLRLFRSLRPWYFFVAALLLAVVCVYSLRSNYQHMVQLRAAVYTADKNGGDVETALKLLRNDVNRHMNTNLSTADGVYPPIQLKYTYDRLVTQESAKVKAANEQIYPAAQAYCEQQNPTDFSGRNRVPCISDYVSSHSAKEQPISDALYKFDFASPVWSPDLAGWSMVLSAVCLLPGIASFFIRRHMPKA